jgi:glycosyltransferase involved in cell wall biosynthesis
MNTLLVVPWDAKRGGVVSVVENVAKHLKAEGHQVLFFHNSLSLIVKYHQSELGFQSVRLRLGMPFGAGLRGVARTLVFPFVFVSSLVQLLWVIHVHSIDIINVHYPLENSLYFAVCRRLLSIRLVTSLHGYDAFRHDEPRRDLSFALKWVLASSDLVIFTSDAYRRKLVQVLPEIAHKAIFIHNGVDIDRFNDVDATTSQHARTKNQILAVAELRDYKGIDVLIRAAAPLLLETPSLRLALAGDGPLRDELERLASSLGIRSQTSFLGTQTEAEIGELLRTCQVKVLPSRSESFGIALIEAMACKAPVIGSRVGGIPEVIEDEVSGLLVERENERALTAALRRILTDNSLGMKFGENGRRRVIERFSARHHGSAYLAAFHSVLDVPQLLPQSSASSPVGPHRRRSSPR